MTFGYSIYDIYILFIILIVSFITSFSLKNGTVKLGVIAPLKRHITKYRRLNAFIFSYYNEKPYIFAFIA